MIEKYFWSNPAKPHYPMSWGKITDKCLLIVLPRENETDYREIRPITAYGSL